jgi:ribosomal subunit interface protein
MANQIQITLRDMDRSPALEERVRRSARKLEHIYSSIVSCRVVVEKPHRRRQQGRQFVVHVGVKVPGGDIVVNRDHHEDVYVALRDAFNAAGRQLEDFARRQRGEVKNHRPASGARASAGASDE